MPFVKDTSYRDMPFSSESPSPADLYYFMTVRQIQEAKYHWNTFRCRTVGVVSCHYGRYFIHELDDSSVQVRLSLAYCCQLPTYTGQPFVAQIFGLVYWNEGRGPVLLPSLIQSIPPSVGFSLRETMMLINQSHVANAKRLEAENRGE